MDVLQWDGLAFLGSGLVQQLRSVYQHPFYLANSFDSEEEARETLSQLMSSVDDVELLDECARRLVDKLSGHVQTRGSSNVADVIWCPGLSIHLQH